jgi:phosphopantetheinyl transferase
MDAFYQSAPLHFLTRDERDRAARYRLEKERRHFVLRRSALRLLLSRYAGISPSAVLLNAVPGEKPRFVNSPTPVIHYSSSSSDELAVFAITRSGRVGVDIESVRAFEDLHDVAQDVFGDEELAAIVLERTEAGRLRAFFSAWTRKEAVLKCQGKGVLPNLRLVNALEYGERLRDLSLAKGYVSALACEEPSTEVTVLEGPLTIDELVRRLPKVVELVAV